MRYIGKSALTRHLLIADSQARLFGSGNQINLVLLGAGAPHVYDITKAKLMELPFSSEGTITTAVIPPLPIPKMQPEIPLILQSTQYTVPRGFVSWELRVKRKQA